MLFLRQNCRNKAEIADLRQEVYMRIYESALKQIPDLAKPFVLTTAWLVLAAALGGLAIGEVVAENPATNPLPGFEHDDIGALPGEFLGAAQSGEPTADDRYVVHLRTAWAARR